MTTAAFHPVSAPVNEIYTGEGPLNAVLQTLGKLSAADANLLLWGESGTGKNLFAYLSHRLSPRRDGPHVEISCAALPASLVETELFGYNRGAFTGAADDHAGRLIQAQLGTLVLDELESLSLESQAKLLRVVETGRFVPLGGHEEIRLAARFIGLTQSDPEKLVEQGILRKELYFRLAVFTVGLPPLRQWRGNLAGLLDFVAREEAVRFRVDPVTISAEVTACLARHPFPGNFREVQNLVRQWTLLRSGETITLADIPPVVRTAAEGPEWKTLERMEREYIEQVLAFTGGKKSEAAHILGIHRKTLLEKRKHYGMTG